MRVIAQETTPWLMMRDFNAVRFMNERVGGSNNWLGWMNDLDSCLCRNGLEDLRFPGQFFTWHNKRESAPIMCKLDRAVVKGSVNMLSSNMLSDAGEDSKGATHLKADPQFNSSPCSSPFSLHPTARSSPNSSNFVSIFFVNQRLKIMKLG